MESLTYCSIHSIFEPTTRSYHNQQHLLIDAIFLKQQHALMAISKSC